MKFRETCENHHADAYREQRNHIDAGKLVDAEYARRDGQHAQQYPCDGRDITRNIDEPVHDPPLPNIDAPLLRLSSRVSFANAFRRRRILSAANTNSADKTKAPKKQPIKK